MGPGHRLGNRHGSRGPRQPGMGMGLAAWPGRRSPISAALAAAGPRLSGWPDAKSLSGPRSAEPITAVSALGQRAKREHRCGTRAQERARSGKLAADEPAGLAAPTGRLVDAPESVCLEELDGAHITAGLVDPLTSRVDRGALQHPRAHRVRVLDRTIQQPVHKAAAPEPRPQPRGDQGCGACRDRRWYRRTDLMIATAMRTSGTRRTATNGAAASARHLRRAHGLGLPLRRLVRAHP